MQGCYILLSMHIFAITAFSAQLCSLWFENIQTPFCSGGEEKAYPYQEIVKVSCSKNKKYSSGASNVVSLETASSFTSAELGPCMMHPTAVIPPTYPAELFLSHLSAACCPLRNLHYRHIKFRRDPTHWDREWTWKAYATVRICMTDNMAYSENTLQAH